MATIDDSDVPETGAVFTFGRSRFADNLANKFWIRNDRIVHINCGDEHSVVVTERGRLYAFGTNDWGQLGLGHTKAANKPSFIKALKPHKMVLAACGRTHTIVASESGKIFSFGAGGDGQLGHGDTEDQNTPKQIEGLPERKVKILSCGVYHSAALFDSGDLYTWGSGSDGQSGHKEEETLAPKVLKFGSKVKWVSCGYYHTAVVTDDGKLYTFGEDENGKLGTTGSKDTSRPQPVATEDGHFIAAACGSGHTVGLTKEGKVFTFGDGSRGQLGQGTRVQQLSEPKVVIQLSNLKVNFVSCGDCHTAAITDRGKLYTFGDGRHGKLAQGEECFSNLFKPQVVSRFADFNVQYVSCGGCHTLVIAVKREEDLSDDEDAEDNILNSSMASTYSHASMPEANATMRLGLQGLSNTLPLISPRDKRRKKEAENLANSLNGSFKHVSKSDLPAISTLDRGRLPALNKLKDAPVIDNKSKSKVNEEITRENNNELLSNKEIEKNIKNSLKASDELAFKSRLENELDDTDKKTNKSKDIKDGGIKDKDSKTLDKQAALASKSKEDSDEEESDGDEESEEDDESSEYEDEEDDEDEAGDEASSKSSKSKTDGSGSKSIEAVAADSKIKPGVSKKEAPKVEAEDDDDEEDDDEEDDEDDEGDDDDDEEESEEEDDDDEEEDDEDDDEDDDDEESETEGEDGDEIKAVKSEDSASSSKEGDKASKVTVEVEANSSNDKNKDNKKSDIKDKSKEKENKKKGKDKSKDSEDKKDGETSGNKNPETADKDDVKSKDGDAEGENNNNENQEKTENTENDKPEEDKKIQKSKFGSIFGKKKPPAATAPAVEVSKDEADGPAAKGTQKKTGKSGVCTIL